MKAIRYTAATLLLLTGILHTVPFFNEMQILHAEPMLVFGIFYFSIGALLLLKSDFSPAWGIIFPLIGLCTGFFVIGVKNWNMLLSFLFAIDFIVVVCCSFLFFNKEKS